MNGTVSATASGMGIDMVMELSALRETKAVVNMASLTGTFIRSRS
jgi:hypothetical protein